MIPGMKQLFSPLNYLRIRRRTVKVWLDWYVPGLMSLCFLLVTLLLPFELNIFGDDGVVDQFSELWKLLIGFYIAALAAVSTFPSAALDQGVSGGEASLKTKRNGKRIKIALSRRRFLSYLFGYLAFMSIVIFISGELASFVAVNLGNYLGETQRICMKYTALLIYIFWSFNMLVTTLLGLHYLTDRIHRGPDGNLAEDKDP